MASDINRVLGSLPEDIEKAGMMKLSYLMEYLKIFEYFNIEC